MMHTEAAEAADVVRRQLELNAALAERIGRRLRELAPRFVITSARGSSDHAATFGKYLIEGSTGLFTTSSAPSIHSVYAREMKFDRSVCIFISQSGRSPDLLAAAEAARHGGAYVIALVNVEDSPLAERAHEILPLRAGLETSVAATKSFIGSLSALLQLVCAWQQDQALCNALAGSPDLLENAWNCDWSAAIEPIAQSKSLFVLGRGLGLGVAQEAALKFKEVCGLHAEAFSSAEVLHGPITIAKNAFPVLVLAQNDRTLSGMDSLVDSLSQRDVTLITAGVRHADAINLESCNGHPAIEPLLRIQSFYRMANELALRLGLDPDNPPFLQKVTATV